MKDKKGFTLIEILAVIIIIGVLLTLVILGISKYLKEGKNKYYIALENQVTLAGQDYFAENIVKLPTDVNTNSLTSSDVLVSNNYISNIIDENGESCTAKVVATKNESGTISYTSCLKCPNYETKTDLCSDIMNPYYLVGAKTFYHKYGTTYTISSFGNTFRNNTTSESITVNPGEETEIQTFLNSDTNIDKCLTLKYYDNGVLIKANKDVNLCLKGGNYNINTDDVYFVYKDSINITLDYFKRIVTDTDESYEFADPINPTNDINEIKAYLTDVNNIDSTTPYKLKYKFREKTWTINLYLTDKEDFEYECKQGECDITIPYTDTFVIVMYGSSGANGGGKGAYIEATIDFTKGDNLHVIVGDIIKYGGGGIGATGTYNGGGATSISLNNNILLTAAGGGGGAGGRDGGTGNGAGGTSVGSGTGISGTKGGGGASSLAYTKTTTTKTNICIDSRRDCYNETYECTGTCYRKVSDSTDCSACGDPDNCVRCVTTEAYECSKTCTERVCDSYCAEYKTITTTTTIPGKSGFGGANTILQVEAIKSSKATNGYNDKEQGYFKINNKGDN